MNFEGYVVDVYNEIKNNDIFGHKAYIHFIENKYKNRLYELKKKYPSENILELYSDEIIDYIFNELIILLKNDKLLVDISIEKKEMLLQIILVKAFIDCNILENPNVSG